jgi:hypothetical protein
VFESGAEHFCFAPIIGNISKCNKNKGANYQKVTNIEKDDKFSVNSQSCISANCECVDNSSPCAVPFLQPRCSTIEEFAKTTEGHSLLQEFPLAYNIVAPHQSVTKEDSEKRSQSLIQPFQLRLGADESEHLSLSAKYANSESDRNQLYELVNNHCDQLKRLFNLVPQNEVNSPTNDTEQTSASFTNDVILNTTPEQEKDAKTQMVLDREHQEWQDEKNDTSMSGIKRTATKKSTSGGFVKVRDNNEESVVAALALCDKAGSFDSSLLSRTFTNPPEVDFLVAVRFIPDILMSLFSSCHS